ncbi:MAG: isochorismatase family protein [Thermodesulfobacteriota bacterium]|jgi:isochorismate hydrolase
MKLDLEKILKELGPYRERKATIDPKHAALLIIDMQNFFHQIIQPILKNLLRVIQSCRQRNLLIIFTQHGHTDPPSDGGVLGEWWDQVILHGTKDWKFIPELKIEPKDTVLPKKRYSAFYKTDLEKILQSKGIQDLIISGVMTNLCCETTARDAFMRDYRVFFLIDGTATGKDDHHLATLKNLGFGFAYLITCDELIQNLKSK